MTRLEMSLDVPENAKLLWRGAHEPEDHVLEAQYEGYNLYKVPPGLFPKAGWWVYGEKLGSGHCDRCGERCDYCL